MAAQKVVLVTGASSGFGAMTVRALADAKHVVYAGMRDIGGPKCPSRRGGTPLCRRTRRDTAAHRDGRVGSGLG